MRSLSRGSVIILLLAVALSISWLPWRELLELQFSNADVPSSAPQQPTIDTVPPIDAEIVEVPAPDGPFGAKGVGEPPVVGVPAAVANAIAAATGLRMRDLPMTPLRVWGALNRARAAL